MSINIFKKMKVVCSAPSTYLSNINFYFTMQIFLPSFALNSIRNELHSPFSLSIQSHRLKTHKPHLNANQTARNSHHKNHSIPMQQPTLSTSLPNSPSHSNNRTKYKIKNSSIGQIFQTNFLNCSSGYYERLGKKASKTNRNWSWKRKESRKKARPFDVNPFLVAKKAEQRDY